MQELSFVAASDDGTSLILSDTTGQQFVLPVTQGLQRALVKEDPPPTFQMRIPVDGPVTPKEVQQRLRHGASVEEVAAEAGMSLERVESFAVPVLQERSFIAQRAQKCPVPGGGSLLEAVSERLRARGITTEPQWDAWRRTDGMWTVAVRFGSDLATVSMGDETGTFTYDPASRSVVAEDDTARWLTNAPEPAKPEPAAIVVIDEDDSADQSAWDPQHPAARAARARAGDQGGDDTTEGDEPRRGPLPTSPTGNTPTDRPLSRRASRRRASRRKAERREPTWDEILFGVTRNDDPTAP